MSSILLLSFSTDERINFGVYYLASYLKSNNLNVDVFDFLHLIELTDIIDALHLLDLKKIQICGVSLTFVRSEELKKKLLLILNFLREKNPDIHFLFGGAINISNEDELLKFSNSKVILGQDKESQILLHINSVLGKIKFLPFDFKTHITRLDDFLPSTYSAFFYLELSKGCLFNCAFCNFSRRKTKSLLKDKNAIISELEHFHRTFSSDKIYILCNTFNDDIKKIKYLESIFDQLTFSPKVFAHTRLDLYIAQEPHIKSFYKKYVKYPFFGIESFDDRVLSAIGKITKNIDYKKYLFDFRTEFRDAIITASFILGLPNDNFDELKNDINWLIDNNAVDIINLNPLGLSKYDFFDDHRNEFSEIEINPESFGFKIENNGEWERSDGYTSSQARADVHSIKKEIRNKIKYLRLPITSTMTCNDYLTFIKKKFSYNK